MSLTKETSFGTECTKQWLELPMLNNQERYCDLCNKLITDFTTWTREDIVDYFSNHSHACGRFTIKQVDPSLRELRISFPKKLFKTILAFAAAFGIHDAHSKPVNKPAIYKEYRINACAEDSPVKPIIQVDPRPDGAAQADQPIQKDKVTNHSSKYFISKRFPFIHKRRSYHFMGCPAF